MITRIVKMHFREEALHDFLKMFEEKKDYIRSQQGCLDLEMLADAKDPSTIFTYSHWDAESSLNNYKGTKLFGKVWKETKSYFRDKPEAWTLNSLYKLD